MTDQNPAGPRARGDEDRFAARPGEVNEDTGDEFGAAQADQEDGERVNMAVAELLAQVADRTNELQRVKTELNERVADLQRLQAEYVNYRKRVERDRVSVREIALQNVLSELLPVLDDIGRAREHDELHGGFRRVAESLENAVSKLGLQAFGTKGDVFDPKVHEALMHTLSSSVIETTCVEILQPGYRLGDRVIRPARVSVAEPDPNADDNGDGGVASASA